MIKEMRNDELVGKRIVELSMEKNISLYRLAETASVPQSTLKNIINGGSKNPGVFTIAKVCQGLDITLQEFFSTEDLNSIRVDYVEVWE